MSALARHLFSRVCLLAAIAEALALQSRTHYDGVSSDHRLEVLLGGPKGLLLTLSAAGTQDTASFGLALLQRLLGLLGSLGLLGPLQFDHLPVGSVPSLQSGKPILALLSVAVNYLDFTVLARSCLPQPRIGQGSLLRLRHSSGSLLRASACRAWPLSFIVSLLASTSRRLGRDTE